MRYADNEWSKRSDLCLNALSELTLEINALLMQHFERMNGSLLHAQSQLILQISLSHQCCQAMPRPQSEMTE